MDAIKIAIRNVLGLSLLCDPFIMKITELRLDVGLIPTGRIIYIVGDVTTL